VVKVVMRSRIRPSNDEDQGELKSESVRNISVCFKDRYMRRKDEE
jgi:hypothetical protein